MLIVITIQLCACLLRMLVLRFPVVFRGSSFIHVLASLYEH